jgi:hypothetical protein
MNTVFSEDDSLIKDKAKFNWFVYYAKRRYKGLWIRQTIPGLNWYTVSRYTWYGKKELSIELKVVDSVFDKHIVCEYTCIVYEYEIVKNIAEDFSRAFGIERVIMKERPC